MASATPATGWRLTPRTGLALVRVEIRKGMAIQWAHPVGHLLAVLVAAGTFLALQYVFGRGTLRRDLLPQTLVAISAMWFFYYASAVMVTDLIEEKNTGTLAQSHITPAPPALLMVGRLATASVAGAVMSVIATGVPMVAVHIAVPARPPALIPYALVLANALAFTFLIAAIAVATPTIAQLHGLIVGLVFLLNGSMLPIALFPHWLTVLARLVPTTLGVEATTKTLFDGASLADIWADGTLPLLLGYTLALTACAVVLYRRNLRAALRGGRLGQY